MDRFTELRDVLGKSASAHDYLKRYAIEGRLRPDRRLIPRDLEEYFGISATPIRDALVRLAAEGFLNWEPTTDSSPRRFCFKSSVNFTKF